MAEIMTVTGPIAPQELGFTSMHEHVLVHGRIFRERYEAFIPEDAPVRPDEPISLENLGYLKHAFILSWNTILNTDVDLLSSELSAFKAEGGSAVVDMSVPGIRFDPMKTREVSEKSGVHIIASTGLYAADSWPEKYLTMTIEEMEEYMSREVEGGIEGTPVKPGHVKVAVDVIDSDLEVKALRAGARVIKRYGLPMCVHQGMELGPEACDRIMMILEEEQVDPSRVVIAHNDKLFVETNLQTLVTRPDEWTLRLEVARALMKKGYNISIDCFGQNWDAETLGILHVHDWQRIAGLYALINEGFSNQIVLGTDTFVKLTYRKFGGEGYCRLTSYVVPTLMSVGVKAETIKQLTVDNPTRILSV